MAVFYRCREIIPSTLNQVRIMVNEVIDHKDEPSTTIVLLCGYALKLPLNIYVYSIRDFVLFSASVLFVGFLCFVFVMDTG